LDCRGLAPHYELEISRPDRVDGLMVRVEARAELCADEHAGEARLLAHKLKAMVGISAQIEVVESGRLKRSTGKASRVTDRR